MTQSLGVIISIPILVISVMKAMVGRGLSANAASKALAEQFNYFQDLSEAELTEISIASARLYPQYEYWQWFSIYRSLRDYGMWQAPGQDQGQGQEPPPPPARKDYTWYILAGVGALLLITVVGR